MAAIADSISSSLAATLSLNENLISKGYCIVEDALPIDVLRTLAEEIALLDDVLLVSSAKLLISETEHVMLSKPQVFELTIVQRSKLLIENEHLLSLIPTLKSIWDSNSDLVKIFKSSAPALSTLSALDQVKVAVIKPGGCFPCHTDVQLGTGRVLSVTLYLDEVEEQESECNNVNDPSRVEEDRYPHIVDNGELRVYPYPATLDENVSPVDIMPHFGRMVLFSASTTYHRVLQSKREHRLCLSLMFYGTEPCSTLDTNLDSSPNATLSRFRNILTPLIYFDEFCKSMREAFNDSGAFNATSIADPKKRHRKYQVDRAIRYFTDRCLHAVAETPTMPSPLRVLLELYASSCSTFKISKALLLLEEEPT